MSELGFLKHARLLLAKDCALESKLSGSSHFFAGASPMTRGQVSRESATCKQLEQTQRLGEEDPRGLARAPTMAALELVVHSW